VLCVLSDEAMNASLSTCVSVSVGVRVRVVLLLLCVCVCEGGRGTCGIASVSSRCFNKASIHS